MKTSNWIIFQIFITFFVLLQQEKTLYSGLHHKKLFCILSGLLLKNTRAIINEASGNHKPLKVLQKFVNIHYTKTLLQINFDLITLHSSYRQNLQLGMYFNFI